MYDKRHLANPGYLFVLPWDPNVAGGVSTVVREMFRELRSSDDAEPVLAIHDWEQLVPSRCNTGVCDPSYRLRLPVLNPIDVGARKLLAFIKSVAQTSKLRELLRTHNVATVNIHFAISAAAIFLVLRAFGLYKGAVVISLHGADAYEYSKASSWRRYLAARILSACDHIVVVSESFKTELLELLPIRPDKVKVIPNGVCITAIPSEDRRRSVSEVIFVCVATYEAKKGIDTTLRAFARASTQIDARLIVVGRKAAAFQNLCNLVRDLGIDAKVSLLSDLCHEEVLNLYESADVLVLNSRKEPFGLVILEAGVRGIPVIASKVGGIAEIISNDSLGILVPIDDVESTQEAIVRLGRDAKTRIAMGARLSAHVRQTYSWTKTTRAYRALTRTA